MKQTQADIKPLKAGTRAELARLQRRMHGLITRPMSPELTLRADARVKRMTLADHAEALFTHGPGLSAIDRLEVYTQQYWYRTLECMEEDFPGVRAVVGPELFQAFCVGYLTRHPPSDFQLRNLGGKFADYLKRRPGLLGKRHRVAWQLARVEWAVVDAFDRAQLPKLDPGQVQGRPPDQVVLRLQPHVTLITSDYALDEFEPEENSQGSMGDQGNAASSRPHGRSTTQRPMPRRRVTRFVVYRQGHKVFFKRIEEPHMLMLEMIRRGRSLADVTYAVFKAQVKRGCKPEQAIGNIRRWFEVSAREGWVTQP